MSTSRRAFLKTGSLVVLAAGVPMGLAQKVMGEQLAFSSGLGLSKAAFTAELDTDFLISTTGPKFRVKLVSVKDLPQVKSFDDTKEGFSLLFRGEQTSPLKQNTYLIEHPRLGTFSFLLVPVMTKDKSAPYYEAIINHLCP
jgi:hypothetical protein